MPYERLEDKRVYQHAEVLADRVWQIVTCWNWFAQKTVGCQWVDATDSIGANVAEASGRFHANDVKKFLYYARGSLRESKYWLRRALARELVSPADATDLDQQLEYLSSEVNAAINFQKRRNDKPD
jgi:four helix bundle protein